MSSPEKPPQSLGMKMKSNKDRATLWESKIVQYRKQIFNNPLLPLSLSGTEGNYIYALLSLCLLWLCCSCCFHILWFPYLNPMKTKTSDMISTNYFIVALTNSQSSPLSWYQGTPRIFVFATFAGHWTGAHGDSPELWWNASRNWCWRNGHVKVTFSSPWLCFECASTFSHITIAVELT